MISKVNGAEFTCGKLDVISLEELRKVPLPDEYFKSKIQISEVVGNIQVFHLEPSNKGALFQAASQFNLLEMVGPTVTPERGVGIYENDFTQGPACAIAFGAGTIYRNYFANVNDQIGQTENTYFNTNVAKFLIPNYSSFPEMTVYTMKGTVGSMKDTVP